MKILFFFAILFSNFTYADSRQEAIERCAGDWSTARVQIHQGKLPDLYSPNAFSGAVLDTVGGVMSAVEALDPVGACGDLDKLTQQVRQMANNSKITKLQTACLVKCVTSQYLTYSTPNLIGTACGAAKHRVVDCKGYATLSDTLLDRLGVESNSITSLNHAFTRVRDPDTGKWYVMEPQEPGCELYPL